MLTFKRVINTIDAHTGGEPLRIVTSGMPPILGDGILDKQVYLRENLDFIRKFLVQEPRGHSGMYGCYVTPPTTEDGDFGVVFFHNEGYSFMCGHGIIAVVKTLIETGQLMVKDGVNTVKIDSPAGRVTAFADVKNERVLSVEFENVPSFVYALDVPVQADEIGEITVDIAFGGAFYVWVEAEKLGLTVEPKHIEALVRRGTELKHKIMDKMNVAHPLEPRLCGIYGTIITAPVTETKDGLHSKNVCIFADAQIDRSPTGTGTSARVALLHKRGLMKEHMRLRNDSILDTVMFGRIKSLAKIGDFEGVIPMVAGTSNICGFNQFVLEEDDNLPEGFRIAGN